MAAAPKDTTKPTEELSLTDKVKRIIPGLQPSSEAAPAGKKRSRKPKSSISAPMTGSAVGHSKDGDKTPLEHAEHKQAGGVIAEEEDQEIEAKRTSAVEATSKRIRAANKKLVSVRLRSSWPLDPLQRTARDLDGRRTGHALVPIP